jgi:hypothetical protein
MKNLFRGIMITSFLALTSVTFATDSTDPSNGVVQESKKAKIEKFHNRLEEIRAIDKSTLTRDEKKVLRIEVKHLKTQAQSDGIYISVGAAIIIVLLLIILF